MLKEIFLQAFNGAMRILFLEVNDRSQIDKRSLSVVYWKNISQSNCLSLRILIIYRCRLRCLPEMAGSWQRARKVLLSLLLQPTENVFSVQSCLPSEN